MKTLLLFLALISAQNSFAVGHEYWRFLMYGVSTGVCSCVGLAELEFYDAAGTYLSTGGTATASSTGGGFGPVGNLFNHNFGDDWGTSAPTLLAPAWVQYHFTGPVDVSTVRFNLQTFDAAPTPVQVQYSDNGTLWTNSTGIITPYGYDQFHSLRGWSISVGSIPGGYFSNWRLRAVAARAGGSFPSEMTEVAFHGVAGGASLTSPSDPSVFFLSNNTDTALNVFDQNLGTMDTTAFVSAGFYGYTFSHPTAVVEAAIINPFNGDWVNYSPVQVAVEGSNDAGANWTTSLTCTLTWTGSTQTQLCGAPQQRGWIAYDQIRPADRSNFSSHIFQMAGSGGLVTTGNPTVYDGNGSTVPANYFGLSGTAMVMTTAPSVSTSPGVQGQFAIDATGNFYFCYGTNQWARIGPGGYSSSF
jgi:hypothetical protein